MTVRSQKQKQGYYQRGDNELIMLIVNTILFVSYIAYNVVYYSFKLLKKLL
jgi:hypothetical protein